MSDTQTVFLSIALGLVTAGVWRIVVTGQLPSQPEYEGEDENDERLVRLFLGGLAFVGFGWLIFTDAPLVPRLLAGSIAVAGALLIGSAFIPRLRRGDRGASR